MSIELLAPAGNLEKLKMAIIYGADAVYIGGERYSLRAGAGNFTFDNMREGVSFAHFHNRRVYLAMNIIPHNIDFKGMEEYVERAIDAGIDAFIVSDPGIFALIKKVNPHVEIHLSTQAGNTNYHSCNFWHSQGINRIVLARELSIEEIREVKRKTPKDLELEAFIHGAMCISYSGRCLLSNYMAGRDSNKGDCAHPCRWHYHLVEEKRPGEYMPVYEDETGTFIFNSKDLCMIEHIPELIESGITSLKIEGRMKSAFYVATVVKAYREALDMYMADPKAYKFNSKWLNEVSSVSHRGFTKGFFFGRPNEKDHHYGTSSYIRNYDFVGVVLDYNESTGIALVEQRNRFFTGDKLEALCPGTDNFEFTVTQMKDDKGNIIDTAPHAQMHVSIPMHKKAPKFSMLRRKIL